MRTTSKFVKALAVLSVSLAFCATGLAQTSSIVYDNSTIDLGKTYSPGNNVEFGDQITLAGTDRTVTDFKFQYFLGGVASGQTALLRFYANDGPAITKTLPDGSTVSVPTPGSLLYTSPVLTLGAGFQTAEAQGFAVKVPDTFTWTVTFNGLTADQTAGLQLYDPPLVGSSFLDFWQNSGGTWNTYLFDNGATPGNFAARVTAVPEPATMAFALLAGLGWAGYLGFKRRSS